MTLINVFVERYIMNITAFMISYHHSMLVLTIYDKGHSFELPRCALSPVLHKNICYLDVCLHMCSSAIRYAWFCTSICIFLFQSLHVFSLFYFSVYFLYHVYVKVFLWLLVHIRLLYVQ